MERALGESRLPSSNRRLTSREQLHGHTVLLFLLQTVSQDANNSREFRVYSQPPIGLRMKLVQWKATVAQCRPVAVGKSRPLNVSPRPTNFPSTHLLLPILPLLNSTLQCYLWSVFYFDPGQ